MPIKERPAQLGPQRRTITMRLLPAGEEQQATVDSESRTLELCFATETPVDMWYGTEILSMEPGAMRTGTRQATMPMLFNHDMSDLLGVVERIWIDADRRARALVRYGKDQRGDWALQQTNDGVLVNVSFMYRVFKWIEDTETETYTAVDWEPYEISLVTVPADPVAGVGRSASPDAENGVQIEVRARSAAATTPPADEAAGVPSAPVAQLSSNPSLESNMPLRNKHTPRERAHDGDVGGAAGGGNTQPQDVLSPEETVTAIRKLGDRFKRTELADILVETGATIEQARTAFIQATGNGGERAMASPVQDMSQAERRSYSLVRAVNAACSQNWKEAGFEREVSDEISKRLQANPDAPKIKGGGNGVRFYVPTDLPFAPDDKHVRAWRMASGMRAGNQQIRAAYQVGSGTGGNLVQTSLLDSQFIEVLRNASVVAQLGARYLTGLVGQVDIPRQTSQTGTYWVGESGAITEAEATFDKVSLRLKTVGALSKMSRQMLMQSTPAIEMLAREDLLAVLALALDLAAISGSGSSNQPTGIVNTSGIGSVVGGTNGANITFDHIIQMKAQPKIANAPLANLGFALNSKTIGYLETLKSTTGQYLWSNGGGVGDGLPTTLKGYPYAESQQLRSTLTKGSASGTCSELVFGNWREVLIAEWGVVELMVNPYDSTGFTNGDVLIRALQSLDVGLRHPASFAVMSDALTPGF